jgi:phage-related protein
VTRSGQRSGTIRAVKLVAGEVWSVYALVEGDVCLVQQYVSTLDQKDQTQIAALLKRICAEGPLYNEEKFRTLGDDIFELKTARGIRILGFFAGPNAPKRLILTHGFRKPNPKRLQREKKKAIAWRDEYFRDTDKQRRS